MTIEKLPSGNYRIVQMYKGKRYRVTVDHKPSQIEAAKLLSEVMEGCAIKGSFREAALEYIDNRRNILSPRTIKEYEHYPNALPQWFVDMPMNRINSSVVQKCVNELAGRLSAKTVRNYHGFIAAVMSPHITLKTALPRVEIKKPYIPTSEDYNALLEAFKGTQYHVVLQLMYHGLRRGEILALTVDDVKDDYIHINKDMVLNSNNEWVIKPPKTKKSTRDVPSDKELADEVRAQGYIYKGHPNNIEKVIKRMQAKLGIPTFNPHALRHLFVSVLIDGGCDMKTAMDVGGWESLSTVEKYYLECLRLRNEEGRKMIAEILKSFKG